MCLPGQGIAIDVAPRNELVDLTQPLRVPEHLEEAAPNRLFLVYGHCRLDAGGVERQHRRLSSSPRPIGRVDAQTAGTGHDRRRTISGSIEVVASWFLVIRGGGTTRRSGAQQ